MAASVMEMMMELAKQEFYIKIQSLYHVNVRIIETMGLKILKLFVLNWSL